MQAGSLCTPFVHVCVTASCECMNVQQRNCVGALLRASLFWARCSLQTDTSKSCCGAIFSHRMSSDRRNDLDFTNRRKKRKENISLSLISAFHPGTNCSNSWRVCSLCVLVLAWLSHNDSTLISSSTGLAREAGHFYFTGWRRTPAFSLEHCSRE